MRALGKLPKPQVLVANDVAWTDAYVAAVVAGDAKRHEKWRHREIKATLREEVRKRCAYCEAFVDDVAFPHVEHIIPKASHPELAHCWSNLTSACGRCNVAKDDYFSDDYALVNPYVDRVEAHLSAAGAIVHWILGSTRGEVTVKRLDLNRMDLVVARARRLLEIREAVERWHEAEGARRETLEEAIRLDADRGEFPSMVFVYLQSLGLPERAADT